MQRTAGGGVSRLPVGAESEIEFAVAIDIEWRNGDIVIRGNVLCNDVPGSRRVLEPQYLPVVDRDDVRLAVAVYIGGCDGVNHAQPAANLLCTKAYRIRRINTRG